MKIYDRRVTALILATVIFYILMITFNGLGGVGYSGLFNQSVGAISDKYPVYITPAGWTFSIWSIIYIYLGSGAIYSLSTVFRAGIGGLPVCAQKPVILNWAFYSILAANYVLNTIWIFIWLADLITAATILLLFIAYTGWVAFAVACFRGTRAMTKVNSDGENRTVFSELRLQRIIIHNGIALYTTWTTIASLLSINISFQYVGQCDAETTSLICLTSLLVILLGWFLMENTYWDSYVRYTLSQYPVVMFAIGGVLSKQLSPKRTDGPVPKSVHILTWVILAVTVVLFSLRLAIVTLRYRTKPLFKSDPKSAVAVHPEKSSETKTL